MRTIGVERAREPTAGNSLIGAQPLAAALDRFIVGGHAGLPQHINDKTGPIAVAGCVLVVVAAVVPFPIAQRRQAPTAVFTLQCE